jgi:hypothetical protein
MIKFPLSELKKIEIRIICSIFESSYCKINSRLGIYRICLNKLSSQDFYLTTLAHELGHILNLCNIIDGDGLKIIRRELTAWRIAKTILPSELFDESRAWYCLSEYIRVYVGDDSLIEKLKTIGLKPFCIESDKLYLIQKFLYKKVKSLKIFKSLKDVHFILDKNLIGLESRLNKSNF